MDCVATDPNIAHAIRRSRAGRAAMRRRRRSIIAAVAIVALGSGLGLAVTGVGPNEAVQAAVTQAKSLAELLNQRSPGERTEAALTKTNRAHALGKQRVHAAPPQPSELARILLAPPPELVPVDLGPTAPLLAMDSPLPIEAIFSAPGGGSSGVIIPGGLAGGGGGSPGGPQSNPSSPPEPLTPIPAVPEPGTWATMMLGFGLIGWKMRCRGRQDPAALAA